ncbi:DUF3558 domain-containing protein [Nocardia sp. NBC_01377]
MRVLGVVAGLCAVLAVAGCSESVSGQPEVSGAPLTKEQLFDPCTLPESVIASTGADPATKDSNPFGTPREAFIGCEWDAANTDGRWGHFILISSSSKSLEDFRTNDYFNDFHDTKVGDRAAFQYYLGNNSPPVECGFSFDTSKGVVTVSAKKYVDSKTTADPCVFTLGAVSKIIDSIPR